MEWHIILYGTSSLCKYWVFFRGFFDNSTFRCWTNHVQMWESGWEGHATEIDTAAEIANRVAKLMNLMNRKSNLVELLLLILLKMMLLVLLLLQLLNCGRWEGKWRGKRCWDRRRNEWAWCGGWEIRNFHFCVVELFLVLGYVLISAKKIKLNEIHGHLVFFKKNLGLGWSEMRWYANEIKQTILYFLWIFKWEHV